LNGRDLASKIAQELRLHPVYDRAQIDRVEHVVEQWIAESRESGAAWDALNRSSYDCE
jgi:hypothetical protein